MKQLLITVWNRPEVARKFIIALFAAGVVAIQIGVAPGFLDGWAPVVVAFATALGVWRVPNANSNEQP